MEEGTDSKEGMWKSWGELQVPIWANSLESLALRAQDLCAA